MNSPFEVAVFYHVWNSSEPREVRIQYWKSEDAIQTVKEVVNEIARVKTEGWDAPGKYDPEFNNDLLYCLTEIQGKLADVTPIIYKWESNIIELAHLPHEQERDLPKNQIDS